MGLLNDTLMKIDCNDNCQSFDRLIPLLDKNVGFLAIDLPGHGFSSRLPPGIMYHYSNYLLTIRTISKHFHWSPLSLMGHSLGAILSYVYSMLYPTEIDFLICLDAMKPMVTSKKHIYIAKAIDQFNKFDTYASDPNEPPSYTLDQMKEMVAKPNDYSVSVEYTPYIMDRNIAPSKINPGKFYFTRDPRVKTGALANFCQDELVRLAENMKMPMFVVKASDSSYYERKEKYYEVLEVIKRVNIDCEFRYVEGRHHVHLNEPEKICSDLNAFIDRYNIHERYAGGLSEDIIRPYRKSYIEDEFKGIS